MGHALDGAWEKVRWAEQHLQTLDDNIVSWLWRNPYRLTGHFYAESNVYVFWSEFPDPPLLEWGVMVGNIVHNLRSPLDHLIVQLVYANGQEPCISNKFPLWKSEPADFATSTKGALRGVRCDHRALILDLKPWHRGHVLNALVTLNELANQDKHHVIVPAFFNIEEGATSEFEGIVNQDVGTITDAWVRPEQRLRSGAVHGWFGLAPKGPNPEMHMKGDLPLRVALTNGRPLIESLKTFAGSVGAVLGHFEPVFEGMPADPIVYKEID